MNVEELLPQVDELFTLLHNKVLPRPQSKMLQQAFEQLSITLEALKVAQEELYQQNEVLYQKTQELEVTRRYIEAERVQALSESQRYRQLFDEAPDGYLVTDLEGNIQEAHRVVSTLLNLPQQLLIGKSVFTFVVEQERQVLKSKLIEPRCGDWVREWEVRICPYRRAPIDVAVTVAVARHQKYKPVALRWLLHDITSRKRAEQQMLHNVFHDALTGLPNRALFINHLEQAILLSKQQDNYLFAVLFLDIDWFKMINDRLGHSYGDQLLRAFALRLSSVLHSDVTFARFGGDEFTILLKGLKDIDEAVKLANSIHGDLRLPFAIGSQEIFTTVSIGIATSVTGDDQPENILHDADLAMYLAKSLGGGCYEVFNS